MPDNNSQKEVRKEALRGLRADRCGFFLALLGLYVFAIILFRAANGDQLEWPNRSRPNILISYVEHPWAYSWIVGIAALGVIFCLGAIWTYLFAKEPE
jgi:hypothetical protein